MDAAEYKHVVLGLIFLKYISDAISSATSGSATRRPAPGTCSAVSTSISSRSSPAKKARRAASSTRLIV
ncbi:MAG: hypothetical protein ACUVSD_10895 [Thiobacillaceae bacterium]